MAVTHVAATVAIRLGINPINPFYLLFLENFVCITDVAIFYSCQAALQGTGNVHVL